MAEERVFLHAEDAYVSNTRVVIRGTTYATANITSVRKSRTDPSRGCALLLAIVAGFASLGTIPMVVFGGSEGRGMSAIVAFFWLVAFAIGILWFRSLKSTFHVMLASAGGERQGLSSFDEPHIDQVTGAVAAAITHRG